MIKRAFDIFVSFSGLVLTLPVTLPTAIAIFLQDYKSPFYVAERVGKDGKLFRMVKFRSMVVNADKSGVDSTSSADARITAVGRFVRAYKLDELTQLWNVFKGNMSLVGPRPNVKRETDLYTEEERHLLDMKPGITDFASIVFSDEGEILRNVEDADIGYNQLIRPGKSRLGLFYGKKSSLWLDIQLVALTAVAIVSRETALKGVCSILEKLGAEPKLVEVARRELPLVPMPPPGALAIVTSRG